MGKSNYTYTYRHNWSEDLYGVLQISTAATIRSFQYSHFLTFDAILSEAFKAAILTETDTTRERAIRDCRPSPGLLLSGVFYRYSGKSNMAAKLCDRWCHMCDSFVPHGEAIICVKFCLDPFSHFRDFWRLKKNKIKTIWLLNHMTDDIIKKFGGPFYPQIALKNFHDRM